MSYKLMHSDSSWFQFPSLLRVNSYWVISHVCIYSLCIPACSDGGAWEPEHLHQSCCSCPHSTQFREKVLIILLEYYPIFSLVQSKQQKGMSWCAIAAGGVHQYREAVFLSKGHLSTCCVCFCCRDHKCHLPARPPARPNAHPPVLHYEKWNLSAI